MQSNSRGSNPRASFVPKTGTPGRPAPIGVDDLAIEDHTNPRQGPSDRGRTGPDHGVGRTQDPSPPSRREDRPADVPPGTASRSSVASRPLEVSRAAIRAPVAGIPSHGDVGRRCPGRTVRPRRPILQLLLLSATGSGVRHRWLRGVSDARRSSGPSTLRGRASVPSRPIGRQSPTTTGSNSRITDVPLLGATQVRRSVPRSGAADVGLSGVHWREAGAQLSRTIRSTRSRPSSSRSSPFAKLIRM
jgi:hypothetical protein